MTRQEPHGHRAVQPGFGLQASAHETTSLVTRGVRRLLRNRGLGTLTEFGLSNGRRADILGLDRKGEFTIVEVKSTVEDFRADNKWREYLDFCDRFYFAVPCGFTLEIMPPDCGLMVADDWDAAIRRESSRRNLNSTRRRHQLIRFALLASERLARLAENGEQTALT